MYYRKVSEDEVLLLVLIQVDNYIHKRTEEQMGIFETFLTEKFDLGSVGGNSFQAYGSEVTRMDDGSITLSEEQKLYEISEQNIVSYETVFSI